MAHKVGISLNDEAYAQGYRDGKKQRYDSSRFALAVGFYQRGYAAGIAAASIMWKQQLLFCEVDGQWSLCRQLG